MKYSPNDPPDLVEGQRPLSVTLFAVGVLILSIIYLVGGFRAYQMSRHPELYISSDIFNYLIIRGIILATIGFFSTWVLLRGLRWAPAFILGAVAFYFLVYWVEWFFAIDPLNRGSNSPFMLVVSILSLLLTGIIFSRPSIRNYYGVSHGTRK